MEQWHRKLLSTKAVDEARRYVESAIFSKLPTLVENSQLYKLEEELSYRPEVTKCKVETGRLRIVFCKGPSAVMDVLWDTSSSSDYSVSLF